MAADFLDEKQNEINARLKELKPLVEEYQRLEAAAAVLDGMSTTPAAPANGSRRRGATPATPPRSQRSSGTGGRRGRPKGSGTRGAEALALVKASPGIRIPELAEKLGIKQNYLYRVLPSLAEEGLVTKHSGGWHATEAA
jgi:anti-sigma factor RsiW